MCVLTVFFFTGLGLREYYTCESCFSVLVIRWIRVLNIFSPFSGVAFVGSPITPEVE